MSRSLLAQTLGSALLPGCLVLSQGALRALDAFPTSVVAWYLNLSVFAPFLQVRAVPSVLATSLDRATMTEFVLVLLLMAALHIVRFRLGVAVLAHLAFAASLLTAVAWLTDLHGTLAPGLILARDASGTALVAVLLAATGLACILGHRAFLLDILDGQADHDGAVPHVSRARRDRAHPPVLSPATRLGV